MEVALPEVHSIVFLIFNFPKFHTLVLMSFFLTSSINFAVCLIIFFYFIPYLSYDLSILVALPFCFILLLLSIDFLPRWLVPVLWEIILLSFIILGVFNGDICLRKNRRYGWICWFLGFFFFCEYENCRLFHCKIS